jgi:hypothetical protein
MIVCFGFSFFINFLFFVFHNSYLKKNHIFLYQFSNIPFPVSLLIYHNISRSFQIHATFISSNYIYLIKLSNPQDKALSSIIHFPCSLYKIFLLQQTGNSFCFLNYFFLIFHKNINFINKLINAQNCNFVCIIFCFVIVV